MQRSAVAEAVPPRRGKVTSPGNCGVFHFIYFVTLLLGNIPPAVAQQAP
jgi:hypothetical protein